MKINAQYESELKQVNERCQTALDDLATTKTNYLAVVQSLGDRQQQWQAQIAALEGAVAEGQALLVAAKLSHDEDFRTREVQMAQKLEELSTCHEQQVNSMATRHTQELADVAFQHSKTLSVLRHECAKLVNAARSAAQAAVDA